MQLKTAIEVELKAEGLQCTANAITKVIQLYETKNSRHSTMIVGKTLAGKTVTWRILQATMTRLFKEGDTSYQIVKVRTLRNLSISPSILISLVYSFVARPRGW